MSTIFRRTPIETWDTTGSELARQATLHLISTAIDNGMVCCALVLATDTGVQFSPDTLRKWLRPPQTVEQRHRRTYAVLYYLKTSGRLPGRSRRARRNRSKKS